MNLRCPEGGGGSGSVSRVSRESGAVQWDEFLRCPESPTTKAFVGIMIFQETGGKSTVLSEVSDVSGWNPYSKCTGRAVMLP